ncbi:MAG TPA: hypothetical protein VM778_04790 [Gemmatimonadota bacterium]|nr:hypothetical protein [Gemmatimonadota bacterium]
MRSGLALAVALATACGGRLAAPPDDLVGTWGGENAGVVVTEAAAHVHIGCTLGDTSGPILLAVDGTFDVAGSYNVDAYPVDRGILHPARFTGRVVGRQMTLTVTLTDTTLQLGPAVLTFGREPEMGTCPICRED